MKIVNQQIQYPTAPLIEPNAKGYIHLAFEVDEPRLPFYLFDSRAKKKLLARARAFADEFRERPGVQAANVFRAVVRPPLSQPFLDTVRDSIHVARFDVAILIETDGIASARTLRADDAFERFLQAAREAACYSHVIVAENARRIGEVDKSRPGVFLFNYFFTENRDDLLAVWEYTAGWFTRETDLDNSTLMIPLPNEKSEYGVINHCRWDSLPRLMPSLIFKPSLRSYVMENFKANKIAVMPILYKLA